MANTSLTRTPSSSSNRKTFTLSAWVKRSNISSSTIFSAYGNASSTRDTVRFSSADTLEIFQYTGSFTYVLRTNRVFRDPSAWYHIVVAFDTTQGTAANRIKIYVNGVQETSFGTETYPSQNLDTFFNASSPYITYIGRDGSDTTPYFNGSMSHINSTDGTAYDASAFGETDATTGIWKPKTAPSVTYGTNGFFLKFENSGAFGTDSSGNGNTFTVNGTMTQTIDTPSNVFATLNPLQSALNGNTTTQTFSNGNLQVVTPNTVYSKFGGASTLGVSQGKYYAEIRVSASGGTYSTYQSIGITGDPSYNANTANAYIGGQSFSAGYYNQGGLIQVNNSTVFTYGTTESVPYDVMIAMDLDNNKVYFGIDGTWVNSGDPAGGTGGFTIPASSTVPTGNYFFATYSASSLMTSTYQANFGNGYFGTTAVSSAQNPDDGIGIFEYDVPTGYRALCTKSINAQEYD